MTGKEIRQEALRLAQRDYVPLLLPALAAPLLQCGFSLIQHFLVHGHRPFWTVIFFAAAGRVIKMLLFFLVLSNYRMCLEQVSGECPRSFLGIGFPFRGARRLLNCFLFYLLYLVPSLLIDGLNLFLRSVPELFQLTAMQIHLWLSGPGELINWAVMAVYNLGVQMILFPALLLFVFRPGQGAVEPFRRGLPLGVRRWASITWFRVWTCAGVYLISKVVSWLAGMLVIRLMPVTPVEFTMLTLLDLLSGSYLSGVLFLSDCIRRLVDGLIMAAALPYLRMADTLFGAQLIDSLGD